MRLAVILFNLGGPDGPAAVEPFLENLFADPAIITLPGLIRKPLARRIAARRGAAARANYALMGGGSPLLAETRNQAAALEAALGAAAPDTESRVFIAMRYWNPRASETAKAVAAFAPDGIVLLPLYPQYSTTTTASSLTEWRAVYDGPGTSRAPCCYPDLPGLAQAHAAKILAAYAAAGSPSPARLLFSAHGLPENRVRAGDPYAAQVAASAAAIREVLGERLADERICYQSRVGPMKWLGPSTVEAIEACGREGLSPVICPIAFVSEHIETLVELDHEYGALARRVGCPAYVRVPALGIEAAFIEALTRLALEASRRPAGVAPGSGWTCGPQFAKCPHTANQGARP